MKAKTFTALHIVTRVRSEGYTTKTCTLYGDWKLSRDGGMRRVECLLEKSEKWISTIRES